MKNEEFAEIDYKALDWALLKRLLVFLKPYKKYIYITLLFALVTSALAPIRPYLSKIAIDKYLGASNWDGLLVLIIIIFSLLVINAVFQFALTYLLQWVGQKVLLDIRIKLYDHLQSLALKYFDKNPVGRLVTRVTNDVEALNELFSSGVVMAVADFLLILWIIGFMFFTSWKLSLLTLTILPFLITATWIFSKKVREVFRLVRIKLAQINSFLNEFITGVSTVKLFTQEKHQNEHFEVMNKDYRGLMIKTIWYHSIFHPTIELLSSCVMAIILWYSAKNILSGEMTIGILIAFIQYTEMFFRPIRDLTEKYTTLQSSMASAERIFSLLDTDIKINDNENAVELKEFKDKIEFKDVTFAYDENKTVLKNVSFTVNKGETVAIVGATGAGKTSIINLLCRFYDHQEGEILIDSIDIKDYIQKSLRKKIALVMQDVFLFSRNILDNISMGDDDIPFEKIQDSAKALGAEEFINKLENKFQTKVTERGLTLSTGQRQLISFCRAYVINPEILILDEATSNIDSETEAVIEKSLEILLKDRTSIVIAHRLSTIKRANKIIVLHHGKVRETGTHQELLALNGIYARLYSLQYNKQ